MHKKNAVRAAFGVAAPALTAGVLAFVYLRGGFVPCLIYRLTGLYCAGCGSGRALSALLHLHPGEAAGYNVLFVAALPLLVYYALKGYLRIVTGRDILPFFHIGKAAGWVMAALLIVFAIMRNLPWYPFTMLAP